MRDSSARPEVNLENPMNNISGVTDYSDVLTKQQQQRQSPQQSTGQQPQQFSEQGSVREQVQSKLANGLGTLSEAASTTGISEQAAHEIVQRAYRSSW
jgi:hypothetical protein